MKKHLSAFLYAFLVVTIGVITGFAGGNLIASKYFTIDVYANLSEEELVDDVNLINYKGKTPDQLSGTEVFVVACHLFNTAEYSENYSSGVMETSVGITQYTTQYTEKNGNTHHNVTLTYGSFMSNATKLDYTEGGMVYQSTGKASSKEISSVEWNNNIKELTLEEFENKTHSKLNNNWAYIISSKTVIHCSDCTIDGDKYTFTIKLDPIKAPLHYAKQISFFMATSETPIFEEITYTFSVDKNFNLLSTDRTENFKLNYAGIVVDVYGTISNILVTKQLGGI